MRFNFTEQLIFKITFLKSLTFLMLFLSNVGTAQEKQDRAIAVIDSLLQSEKFEEALQKTNELIETLFYKKQYDSIVDCINYLGRTTVLVKNETAAKKAVQTLSDHLQTHTQKPKTLRQLSLETADFFAYLGDNQTAIKHNFDAMEFSKKMPDNNGELLGIIYSNLGVLYSRSGDFTNALKYHQKAISSYKTYSKTRDERYFITYNALGGMMWHISKIDSALYYYKEAEKILNQLEPNPYNKYYRPASLNNNMAAIYNMMGDADTTLATMQKVISNLNLYIKEDVPQKRRQAVREFLFQAIDNYASVYTKLGDHDKAKTIFQYANNQKLEYLGENHPEFFKGQVLLGSVYLNLKEYDNAIKHLERGIDFFENTNQSNLWLADAYKYKASLYWEQDSIEVAKTCFEKSENYYKKALGNYYDENYLDFIVHASQFYAKNGYAGKARQLSQEAYNYIIENQGVQTLLEYYQILNLAEVAFVLKNYQEALNKSVEALNLLNDPVFAHKNKLGKLQITAKKPEAILVKVKSELQLHDKDDISFIQKKYKELQEAIAIIEQEKTLLTQDRGISILIADNNDVFEFAKVLALKLYQATGDQAYLDDMLGLHESLLYNKIRTRLNARSSVSFNNIPEKLLEKEQQLKTILNAPVENTEAIDSLMKARADWDELMHTLKNEHPKYYNLKYASISKSLPDISSKIKNNTTVIRYTFTGEELYAFVISDTGKNLIPLDAKGLDTLIVQHKNENNFRGLNTLYGKLWKPLEKHVKTEKVVIVPDQALFNLSFELLTPRPADDVGELAKSCLLSKHVISYHYSLFLLGDGKTIGYDKPFVAFVPEFNDSMKEDYRVAITDSLTMDKTYLSLLRQPFSLELAKQYASLFEGTYFANKKASKPVFLTQANEYKIIHIGTHAESNNVSPQLSRLIFAKSTSGDDNSLYTYEIYNQNFNANLAVLTACETGKPAYQPGEGMISLAHAFNYAGSESILTSLWEIDEQSSTEIVELFYDNLAKGLDKAKALQLAKLDYIKNAVGRTASPQYWAGLVLIGETSPINIEKSSNLWWAVTLTIAVFILLVYFLIRRYKST